ncbi:MAG: prepilin-type N-terminal cleavage/methylation domain-containing protein [Desulfatiglans sp.]|jgi:prepilin-type N-terminal cleavage/methylation domain-containing protein|nr:prepilin-type N-terminal cleavage/methylation domain-containing protein [Thermodesulfobacteriota bacterium]MEE4352957.1 prepilin-type N-terminal cleavage/methylation domain-containing protein [Desulfatiglans sp.]
MAKQAQTKKGEQGFTLLEVIIAVSVLTIGILAVASMQLSAIIGNASAGSVTEALSVCQDKLEELIGLPLTHDDLIDTNGDGNIGLDFPTAAQVRAGGDAKLAAGGANQPDHSRQVSFAKRNYYVYWNANPGATGSIDVSVVVAWHGGGAMHRAALHYIKYL